MRIDERLCGHSSTGRAGIGPEEGLLFLSFPGQEILVNQVPVLISLFKEGSNLIMIEGHHNLLSQRMNGFYTRATGRAANVKVS